MPLQEAIPPRRPLGDTGLQVHPLGFGCYRVIEGNTTHEAALRSYLERGGNLIDTSANYGIGRAELMVGKVLKEDAGADEAIIVTKGGYIQGENMALALKHNFPEIVEYGDDIWHCIHPEFLETQIRRSAQRLRVNTIDAYLLHNPEYYLEDAAHKGNVSEKHHGEFYRRIREAFRFLEEKVAKEEIRWYGVSSNNFVHPSTSPTMTSIERCWEAAQEVSPAHHFRVVQLPLNLYENGAALDMNNAGKTALQFCSEKNIGVLANRPLNAIARNHMTRLADFLRPGEQPPSRERLQEMLAPLRKLESELSEQFEIPLLYGTEGGIADYLGNMIPQITSAANWEQAYYPYVIQPIERWAVECQQLYGGEQEWKDWWQRFSQIIPATLEEARRFVSASQQKASDEIRARLEQAGYLKSEASLSQMALNTLLHLPGLTSVLVGMRRPEYVEDTMAALSQPGVDSVSILDRFRELNA